MMNAVSLAQHFVVGTSRWPALRHLYLGAYDLGLAVVVRGFKSVPGVQAVMVRESQDRRWAPGWSDYDLTMLIARADAAATLEHLDVIWRRYRHLKRRVPPLGEMEIMHADEYRDFVAFGPMQTASLKHARPLFAKVDEPGVEDALATPARPPQAREFVVDALMRYMRFFFPAWLAANRTPSAFARRRAHHLLQNVQTRLGAANGRGFRVQDPEAGLSDRTLDLFRALSETCAQCDLDGLEGGVDAPRQITADREISRAIQAAASDVIRTAAMDDCSVVMWTPYMSAARVHVVFVVPDEMPRRFLERLLTTLATSGSRVDAAIGRAAGGEADLQNFGLTLRHPVVMSRSMWRCMRALSPFLGAAVAVSGHVLAGPDHGDWHAPSLQALVRGAEVEYAALLPLKNNWRPLRGPLTPRIYEAIVNHASGYLSAICGQIVTSPARREIPSAVEGYRNVTRIMSELRERLVT